MYSLIHENLARAHQQDRDRQLSGNRAGRRLHELARASRRVERARVASERANARLRVLSA